MAQQPPPTGVFEWAARGVNIASGCEHNCRYCYARAQAVRFKRETAESWPQMTINAKEVLKGRRKLDGATMFPTTHDITPSILNQCIEVLRKLLEAGNQVLIVTKPHRECILGIHEALERYQVQMHFRFTMGTSSDNRLSYWEPGAPTWGERGDCLVQAHQWGYRTSISMEPLLTHSFETLNYMIGISLPYVTDSIWLGPLNKPGQRVTCYTLEDRERLQEVLVWHDPEWVRLLYERYRDHPKIRWKDEFKKILGLPLNEEVGLDR